MHLQSPLKTSPIRIQQLRLGDEQNYYKSSSKKKQSSKRKVDSINNMIRKVEQEIINAETNPHFHDQENSCYQNPFYFTGICQSSSQHLARNESPYHASSSQQSTSHSPNQQLHRFYSQSSAKSAKRSNQHDNSHAFEQYSNSQLHRQTEQQGKTSEQLSNEYVTLEQLHTILFQHLSAQETKIVSQVSSCLKHEIVPEIKRQVISELEIKKEEIDTNLKYIQEEYRNYFVEFREMSQISKPVECAVASRLAPDIMKSQVNLYDRVFSLEELQDQFSQKLLQNSTDVERVSARSQDILKQYNRVQGQLDALLEKQTQFEIQLKSASEIAKGGYSLQEKQLNMKQSTRYSGIKQNNLIEDLQLVQHSSFQPTNFVNNSANSKTPFGQLNISQSQLLPINHSNNSAAPLFQQTQDLICKKDFLVLRENNNISNKQQNQSAQTSTDSKRIFSKKVGQEGIPAFLTNHPSSNAVFEQSVQANGAKKSNELEDQSDGNNSSFDESSDINYVNKKGLPQIFPFVESTNYEHNEATQAFTYLPNHDSYDLDDPIIITSKPISSNESILLNASQKYVSPAGLDLSHYQTKFSFIMANHTNSEDEAGEFIFKTKNVSHSSYNEQINNQQKISQANSETFTHPRSSHSSTDKQGIEQLIENTIAENPSFSNFHYRI